jgi:hypothetical protein
MTDTGAILQLEKTGGVLGSEKKKEILKRRCSRGDEQDAHTQGIPPNICVHHPASG